MTETQITWINQLKQGNELAAFNLYNSYSRAMYNTLIRIAGDSEIAKDLLQEAFIKAFKKVKELDEPMAFGGWLKRIVINTGLEHVRKKQYVFEEIDSQQEIEEEIEDVIEVDNEKIHQAIKSLPDGCRTVLSLFLLEGYKHSEISKKLSISESTSKTQYRHAKKILKEKLSYHYENR